MKKKLLAVSVAGAFALPGVALAQTTVTISGFFKGGFESLRYGQSLKNPASQSGVVDDSSRIIFGVREDLGGGMAAIGQLDIRFGLDSGAINAGGNTWVGLTSKDWGRLRLGRLDMHYIHRESELTVRGSLRADSISLLAYAGGGGTAIANATRTWNVVNYTTPNWSGFTLDISYSANPGAAEADINSGVRRGRAWNVNPNMAGKNWQVGYSYWSSKPDGVGAIDQRADRLYGSYSWGGLKIGLAWDKSKLRNLAGVTTSNRTAWSLPVQYTWGPHGIYGHYTKARDDKATVAQDGARMWALSYAYNFSKRTSVALTYASIRNDAAATYNLFTSAALGLGAAPIAAGEDPRTWGVTLRHAF
jgi:predicted porin